MEALILLGLAALFLGKKKPAGGMSLSETKAAAKKLLAELKRIVIERGVTQRYMLAVYDNTKDLAYINVAFASDRLDSVKEQMKTLAATPHDPPRVYQVFETAKILKPEHPEMLEGWG